MKTVPKRTSWQDAFRKRYSEFCAERGLPEQETEAGWKAAQANSRRAQRAAEQRNQKPKHE